MPINNWRWAQQYKQSVRRIKEFIMFDRTGPARELVLYGDELIERSSLLKEFAERKKFFEEAQLEIGIEPEYLEQARQELIREAEEREAKLRAFEKRLKAIYIRTFAIAAVIGVFSIPIISFLLYVIIAICHALEKVNIHLGTNLVWQLSLLLVNTPFLLTLLSLVVSGYVLFKMIVNEMERTDIPN